MSALLRCKAWKIRSHIEDYPNLLPAVLPLGRTLKALLPDFLSRMFTKLTQVLTQVGLLHKDTF